MPDNNDRITVNGSKFLVFILSFSSFFLALIFYSYFIFRCFVPILQ